MISASARPEGDPLAAETVLERSAFFGALPPEARAALASCLERLDAPAATLVVREGEPGDCYYLIADGEVEVWAARGARPRAASARDEAWTPRPGREVLLAQLGPGQGFGEMALLLGGPRRATVRAASDLVLYSLDAATFRRVVDQHRSLSIALEEEMALRSAANFLGRTSAFATLTPDALRWVAGRLELVRFEASVEIVRQGEPGDAFYIVRSGQVEVTARRSDGDQQVLATLGPGDPFGEQALLTDEPRSATVRAREPVEVFRLSRADFEDVLERHRHRAEYFLQLALQRQRPRRIDHWEMARHAGPGGHAVYVLKDVERHRYLKLSEQGAFLWDLMDGEHSVRDLTRAYFERYRAFGLHAVLGAILQLHAAGFVRIQELDGRRYRSDARPSTGQRLRRAIGSALVRYYALPDVDGAIGALYRYLLRPLYHRVAQAILLAFVVAGSAVFLAYLVRGTIQIRAESLGSLGIVALFGLALGGILHELGHAVTCKHFGRAVHRVGVGWYYFLPVAFADTSDIWLAGKWPRIAVSLAGSYVSVLLGSGAALLMALVSDAWTQAALFLFATMSFAAGLRNLNPLLEYDGYYVLADLLEVPDLRARALAYIGATIWRTGPTTRDSRLRRIFIAYGLLTLGYTALIAVVVLIAYQQYVAEAVARVASPIVATTLGGVIAGAMAGLILLQLALDLYGGVHRTRQARLGTDGAIG